MSTRQMARYYSGGGYSGGGSGLLTRLLGKDSVTGGPIINPDGTVSFRPYEGSSGFLGGQSRREAANLNQQLAMLGYEGDLNKQLAKIQGEEDRKTKEAEGKIAKEKAYQQAILDFAKKWDIHPDDVPAFKNDVLKLSQLKMANEQAVQRDTGYQNALIRGQTADAAAPAIRNQIALNQANTVKEGETMISGKPISPYGEEINPADVMKVEGAGDKSVTSYNEYGMPTGTTKQSIPGKMTFPLTPEEKTKLAPPPPAPTEYKLDLTGLQAMPGMDKVDPSGVFNFAMPGTTNNTAQVTKTGDSMVNPNAGASSNIMPMPSMNPSIGGAFGINRRAGLSGGPSATPINNVAMSNQIRSMGGMPASSAFGMRPFPSSQLMGPSMMRPRGIPGIPASPIIPQQTQQLTPEELMALKSGLIPAY